jgi:Flp pilus assembly protein TadB
MASCLFALFAQLSAYRSIHATAQLIGKPDTYIKYLKEYQKDRHRLNTQKYKVYTLFLGIGLVLFFVEIFFVATLWFTLISFAASLIWIAICYFWLMKAYIRREDGYLNGMIASLEHLERQFEQD